MTPEDEKRMEELMQFAPKREGEQMEPRVLMLHGRRVISEAAHTQAMREAQEEIAQLKSQLSRINVLKNERAQALEVRVKELSELLDKFNAGGIKMAQERDAEKVRTEQLQAEVETYRNAWNRSHQQLAELRVENERLKGEKS